MALARRGIDLLVWIIVFRIICTVIVGLRFWAAHIKKRRLYADDYMIIVIYVSSIALEAMAIRAIANGLGALSTELDASQLAALFQFGVASYVCWALGTVLCKIAMVWLYMRIFVSKVFKRFAWATIALCAAYGIVFFCIFMTQCQPVSQPWNPVPSGYCRDNSYQELTSVTLNIVLDLIIIFLPMQPLWGLQMRLRDKITISFMFCIGFITIAVMAVRLWVTARQFVTTTDFSIGFATVALLGLLELWLGVIATCMPTLAPLMNEYIRPAFSKISGRYGKLDQQSFLPGNKTIGGSNGTRSNRSGLNGTQASTDQYEISNLYSKEKPTSQWGSVSDTDGRAAGGSNWTGSHDIRVTHDVEVEVRPTV